MLKYVTFNSNLLPQLCLVQPLKGHSISAFAVQILSICPAHNPGVCSSRTQVKLLPDRSQRPRAYMYKID